MPIGVIIDAAAVLLGGLCGALMKGKISTHFAGQLNLVFGACSMAMGVSSIFLMKNMPAVVFSLILGSTMGLLLKLGQRINRATQQFIKTKDPSGSELLVTAIVLFCASGTGIYGSIVAGFTGDHSILIAKAILDFFTAAIFACSLGPVVSLIALPQVCIFLLLFLLAGVIYPLTSDDMIADFKACGGVIMLATGFRMANIRSFPVADMTPAMLFVIPISHLWTAMILPLLS